MGLDGKNIQKLTVEPEKRKEWEAQEKILNGTCGGSSDSSNPISVISPTGATLGTLKEAWEPEWSPDGKAIAVACGRDENGNVVVVGNTERTGSREGWSRESSGSLSDRIEIYIVKADGSEIIQLTANEAGDWLPRWFPSNSSVLTENNFSTLIPVGLSGEKMLYSTPLLIESNRDGNSEIYILSTTTTDSWRLTENEHQDQSPAWSSNGNAVVFSSNKNGEFEIFYTLDVEDSTPKNTGIEGRPSNN